MGELETSSIVLVQSPRVPAACWLAQPFPTLAFQCLRKAAVASHLARAGMCQLLLKGAVLALSPVQGMGRAALFPTAQSTCTELHRTPKPGEAFLGLGIGFKTTQRGCLDAESCFLGMGEFRWDSSLPPVPALLLEVDSIASLALGPRDPVPMGPCVKGGMCCIPFL